MSGCHPFTGDRTPSPGSPAIQSAIAGDGRAIVTWSLPPAGSVSITGYTVISNPGNITVEWVPGPLSVVVTGLTNGVTYTFSIIATNGAGSSPPSEPSPPVIPGSSKQPSNVVAVAADKAATVTWSPVTDASSYIVISRPGGATVSTPGLVATVSGLTNGTLYTFTVAARNIYGTGPPSSSNAVTPRGLPSAPILGRIIVGTGVPNTTIVTWSAPNTGGSPITNYTVSTVPASFIISTQETQATFTGLTPGVPYVFSITASNVYGTGPATQSTPITVGGVPGFPTNVVATLFDTSANITWTAAPDNGFPVTLYTIDSIPGGLSASVIDTSIRTRLITDLTATISGLTYGITYRFTVTATNSRGTGPTSVPSNSILPAGPPSTVTQITATRGDGSALIAWSAPADNGSAITGYTIVSNPGGITVTTANLSAVVPGLINGIAYTFTVTAVNAYGSSPTSAASNTIYAGRVPDAPTIDSVTANIGSATVSWSAPPNNGSTVTSYTVTSTPEGVTVTTSDLTATIQGLTNGVGYSFTVAATNGIGTGPNSLGSDLVSPKGPPAAPTIVAFSSGDGFVTLSWTAPPSFGIPITNYTVSLIPGGRTINTTELSTTVSGLTNGIYYIFRVNATNAYGTGPASAQSPPILPTGSAGEPRNVLAASGNGSATVTWSAPLSNGGTPIIAYNITSFPGSITTLWTSGPLSVTVPNLINGRSYYFTVSATNSFGIGPVSPISNIILLGAPEAPTNVLATGGNRTVSLVWTNPSGVSSPIQYYTVYPNPSHGTVGAITQGVDDGGTSTCVVTGLTNGVSYTFTVTASNALCTGPFSAVSNTVIPLAPLTVPGVPLNVTATGGNNLVNLSWTIPSNGGTIITSYIVTGGGTVGTITIGATTASCTITSLMNGLTYFFYVRAVNSVGPSPIGTSNSVVPSSVPGVPLNIVAERGNTIVYLSWTSPHNNGQPILYYTVAGSGTIGTIVMGNDGGGISTTIITGLTNGTSYTYTVTATNDIGTSAVGTSNVVIPAPLPGIPTNIVAFPYDTAAGLTWTNPSSAGYPFTAFIVTGGGTVGAITIGDTTSSCIITGLTNGSQYTFNVVAQTSIGRGRPGVSNTIIPLPAIILSFTGTPTITLPITGPSQVDFGNGIPIASVSGTVSGPVKLYGAITSFGSPGWTGVSSLRSVSSWYPSILSLANAFNGATSLTSVPTLPPSVTDVSGMFQGATAFNQNISSWNVSNVSSMNSMFAGATSFAATGLSAWTPTAARNMDNMFRGTSAAYVNTTPTGPFRVDLRSWPSVASSALFFSPNGTADRTIYDPFSPFAVPMVLTFAGTPTITLPITGAIGTVYVDYGDGILTTSLTGRVTGPVRIYGTFTGFGADGWAVVAALRSVSSWPSTLTNLSYAFAGATGLTSVPSTIPASVTNTSHMFFGATAFNQNLSGWNISNVTDMSYMFAYATSFTATGLSAWTPTAATNMDGMFRGTTAAYTNGNFNTDISTWPSTASRVFFFSPDGITDTTLTDPRSPFNPANGPKMVLNFSGTPFITLPITGPVTTVQIDYGNGIRVSDLSGTVIGSGPVRVYGNFTGFTGFDWAGVRLLQSITTWPATLTTLRSVFYYAALLTSVPSTLPSSVTNLQSTFNSATIFNQDLSGWNVTNVTDMDGMFQEATAFNGNLSGWNVSNVVQMGYMFDRARAFTAAGLYQWTPTVCTRMQYMFNETSAAYTNTTSSGLFLTYLGNWPSTATDRARFFSPNGSTDTSTTDPSSPFTVPSMILTFTGTPTITLPISGGTVKVHYGNNILSSSLTGTVTGGTVKIYGPFTRFGADGWAGVTSLTGVTSWPSSLTNLSYAFKGATNLTSVPSLIPASVTNTSYMFYGATAFNQNLSGWNISNVTDMSYMFAYASSFTATGLSAWTPIGATNMDGMFRGTTAAYTNGNFNTDISTWPSTASRVFFFSPNGTTDTTVTDPKSPFNPVNMIPISMELTFSGTPFITLPITGPVTTVRVDYGNGSRVADLSGTVIGSGIVRVYGNFTGFGYSSWAGITSLRSVSSWPSTLTNLSFAFAGATGLTSVPTLPSSVINLESMFGDALAFNQNLSGWNVSNVRNMTAMFQGARAFSAAGLGQWTPTACTDMSRMFMQTNAAYTNTTSGGLFLTDLGSWPSTATGRERFFSPDGSTDTTLTDPKSPFFTGVSGSTMTLKISPTGGSTVTFGDFPRGNITVYWGDGGTNSYGSTGTITHNYNAGTYYISIVGGISNFQWSSQAPSQGLSLLTRIVYWNCNFQFFYANNLTSVPSFLPASAIDLNFGLAGASKLNQNLSGWDVSNVRTMKCFFQDCTAFTAEGLDQWNLASCTYVEAMFNNTTAAYTPAGRFITNLSGWINRLPPPLSAWTSTNPNRRGFFFSPDGITETTISDPNSPFKDPNTPFTYVPSSGMSLTFVGTPTITLPIIGSSVQVDFGNGTSVSSLTGTVSGPVRIYGTITGFGADGWAGVSSLQSVVSWPSTLTTLANAFKGAIGLTSVPATLPSTVTILTNLFQGATAFNQNLSGWNVTNVTSMNNMFRGASASYSNTTSTGLFNSNISGWSTTATPTFFFSPDGTTDTTLTDPISPFYLFRGVSMALTFSGTPAITLPIRDAIGTVEIDYGNGTRVSSLSGTVVAPGTVRVYGNFTGFGENGWAGVTSLLSVSSWPSTLQTIDFAFRNAVLLTSVPSILPSSVTRIESTFRNAISFNQDISGWNVTNVVNMNGTFWDASGFNGNISGWNVSNVTDTANMFRNATAFNRNLGAWNLSRVLNTTFMFNGATAFNQAISGWNVSTVTNMMSMFKGATAFNQDISGWNVSSVVNMESTFEGATAFNKNIGAWNVSNVLTMISMFAGATAYTATGLNQWVPTACTAMTSMFDGTSAAYTATTPSGLFRTDLTSWPKTASNQNFFRPNGTFETTFTDPKSAFYRIPAFALKYADNTPGIQVIVGGTSIIVMNNGLRIGTNAYEMVPVGEVKVYGHVTSWATSAGREYLTDIVSWITDASSSTVSSFNAPSLQSMCLDSIRLTSVPSLLPSSVTNLNGMFQRATIFNGNISNWNTTNVTIMASMFDGATAFNSDISQWNVSSVLDMPTMFQNATSFNRNLSAWNVSNVTNMWGMFINARSFTAAGLSAWRPRLPYPGGPGFAAFFKGTSAAYTNTTSSGTFIEDLTPWKLSLPSHVSTYRVDFFFSPNETTDTTLIDPNSPFATRPDMVLNFSGTPSITLPITGGTVQVDYGNGTPVSNLSGTVVAPGQVRVYGTFTGFGSSGWTGVASLLSVTSWPSTLQTIDFAFRNAVLLTAVPSTLPSSVTRIESTFRNATSFNQDISGWNTVNVINMNGTFWEASVFNGNISGWNVTNVTDTANMFRSATAFNRNLGAWNVSKVLNTSFMFNSATAFAAAGLNQWVPTAVTNMNSMFDGTSAAYTNTTSSGLFLTDLISWPSTATSVRFFSPNASTDTSFTDPKSPFYLPLTMTLNFTGTPNITLPITGGTVRVDYGNGTQVSSLSGTVSAPGTVRIYGNFTGFGYPDWDGVRSLRSVSSWPSTLTSLTNAFAQAMVLTSIPSTLPSSVTNLDSMFIGAAAFNQNISGWNVSNVTSMDLMFAGATSFTAAGLNLWTPIACTNMNGMFRQTSAAYTNTTPSGVFITNLSNWPSTASRDRFFSPNGSTDTTLTDPNSPYNPVNVPSMILTFTGTPTITLPITGGSVQVDYGNGTRVSSLTGTVVAPGPVRIYGSFTGFGSNGWAGVTSLRSVSAWPALTSLTNAFTGATSLTSVPTTLPSGITNLASLFQGATSFNQNLSGWNVSNVTNMNNMFRGASASYSNTTSSGTFNHNLSSWFTTGTRLFLFSPDGTTDTTLTDTNSPFNPVNYPSMVLTFVGNPNVTLPIADIVAGNTIEIDFGNGIKVGNQGGTVTGTVKVYGLFTRFGSNGWTSSALLRVLEWPSTLTNLELSFPSASQLISVPSTLPSGVTNLTSMFRDATSFNQNLSSWNVSGVTTMSGMFQGATSFTAAGLDSWTPTSCGNMNSMFSGATAAYSSGNFITDLSRWPNSAQHGHFFSTNGVIDTSESDLNSPFSVFATPTMELTFTGTPTITLPITGPITLIKVDYGNGTRVSNLSGTVVAPGTVRVYGNFTGFGSSGWTGLSSLRSMTSWPSTLTTITNAFAGATNLTAVPSSLPSGITNLVSVFQGTTALNQNLSWTVTNVTNMTSMFQGATSFNGNISGWNVSGVTNMTSMFQDATAFNQGLNDWNVSNVTNMTSMFQSATAFNQSISNWNISGVLTMTSMFQSATSFNGNISGWNISNVLNLISMFQGATSFNQSLTSWTPTACTNMSNMFRGTTASYTSSLFNHDLANWRTTATHAFFFSPNGTTDTSETDPKSPFTPVPPTLALAFTGTPSITLPIYEITNNSTIYVDYGNGTTVTSFSGNVTGSGIVNIYGSFTVFGSENWSGVGSVTRIVSWSPRIIDFSNAFRNATSLTSVPSTLPSTVRNIRNMFLGATSFNQNISGWDVTSVTNMEGMFQDATAFTSAGMSAWRTTAVTNVTNMFRNTSASYTNTTSSGLFLVDLRSWQTGNINSRDKFFCPDNSTDTTTTDPKSPFS